MDSYQTTQQEKKLIEGRITFKEKDQSFKRNSVLGIYRFINRHHGNAFECIQTREWVPPLNKTAFLTHHLKPALWTAKYHLTGDNLTFEVREEEENPFKIKDYDPTALSNQILEPTRPEIHWIFNEPGPHFINAYWIRSQEPQQHTFLAHESHPAAIQKLEWLTENLAKQLRQERKSITATFSLDGEIQKTF